MDVSDNDENKSTFENKKWKRNKISGKIWLDMENKIIKMLKVKVKLNCF